MVSVRGSLRRLLIRRKTADNCRFIEKHLSQAKAEGDVENEKLILDSLAEIGDAKKT
jgi:hypothetical protein